MSIRKRLNLNKIKWVFNSAINILHSDAIFLFSILNQLMGTIPDLLRANFIISKNLYSLKNEEISSGDERLNLSIELIKGYYNKEIERLNRIEDKARSTVTGVTIAITIISAPSILLPTRIEHFSQQPTTVKYLVIISLVLAVFFLLGSGYFAFLSFKIGRFSKPLLVDHPSLMDEIDEKKAYISYIEKNQLRIMKRSNYLSTSMSCLRNGLLLFFFLLIFSSYTIIYN